MYRPLKGVPIEACIKRTSTGWFASILCDVGEAPKKEEPKEYVGIDVGLSSFATLSTGEKIPNPRYYRESEVLLAERQRKLAKKKKRSKSRKKAKKLVAKTHQKITNQRLDFVRKLAKDLYKRFDFIAFENLNIAGMAQNHCLSKSILDAAWGLFILCLTNKAEEAGKWAVGSNPYGTSQDCSGCGERVPKTLADREHVCPYCGLKLDRDHNAALNILALGRSVVSCGDSKEPPLAEAQKF